jgi:hypothetical protein
LSVKGAKGTDKKRVCSQITSDKLIDNSIKFSIVRFGQKSNAGKNKKNIAIGYYI